MSLAVTPGLDADVLDRAERVIDLTGKMGDTSVTRAVAIELAEEVKRLRKLAPTPDEMVVRKKDLEELLVLLTRPIIGADDLAALREHLWSRS